MKKYAICMALSIISFLITMSNAHALSCSSAVAKELSRLAQNIKVSYEVVDKSKEVDLVVEDNATTYKIPDYEFWITIYNLAEGIAVEINDDTFGEERVVRYSDSNSGTYTFIDYDFGTVHNYNFAIITDHSECSDDVLRTVKLTRPRYNAYSEFEYCKNSSIYYCQRFITSSLNIDGTNDFLSKIYVNNEKNDPETESPTQAVKDLLVDNWQLYVGIFAGVAVLFVVVLIVLKRRNKNKGWKL